MVTYIVQYKYVGDSRWLDSHYVYSDLQEALRKLEERLESEDVYRNSYPEYVDDFMEHRLIQRDEKLVEP